MAVLCGTVQSEISKLESTGEIEPEDVPRFAKAYGWTKKRFKAECSKLRWLLPLWRFAVSMPAEIETIQCAGATVIDEASRGRTEGKLASIYDEAEIIGQDEQHRRAM